MQGKRRFTGIEATYEYTFVLYKFVGQYLRFSQFRSPPVCT